MSNIIEVLDMAVVSIHTTLEQECILHMGYILGMLSLQYTKHQYSIRCLGFLKFRALQPGH